MIPQGDRIAQLVLLPQVSTNDPFLKGHRGNQGFGSTGTCAISGSHPARQAPVKT